MNNDEIFSFIKEMFPNYNEDGIKDLINQNYSAEEIVDKILNDDKKNKGITLSLNETLYNLNEKIRGGNIYVKKNKSNLNYEKIFSSEFIDTYKNVDTLRSNAEDLIVKANEYSKKAHDSYLKGGSQRKASTYFSQEAETLRKRGMELNKEASTIILESMLRRNNRNVLDFHKLYAKECVLFLEDYIKEIDPTEFSIITGAENNSKSIRPAVIKYLESKGYFIENEGALIRVKKCKDRFLI